MVKPYLVLIALIGAERLFEMHLSRKHSTWAFSRGGIEVGQRHFPWMVALHAAFLLACAAEVVVARRPFIPALGLPMLAALLAAQALRYWAVATLGPYWNIRVIVVPGAEPVTAGPYRYLRHPNYLAVILEGLALPLVHTAYVTAGVFTLFNAVVLSVRIRSEEQALATHCDYLARLGNRRRILPGRPEHP